MNPSFFIWFFGPTQLLQLLHIHEQSTRAYVVATLISLKLYLLFGLTLNIMFKRLKRRWTRRDNFYRQEVYRKAIFGFLFAENESLRNQMIEELALLLKNETERGFFRRLLLIQIEVLTGSERTSLIVLYKVLGFLDSDFQQLNSKKWWKRLEAIVRLDLIRTDEAIPFLENRMDDSNELVALAAMRALSALAYPDKTLRILDCLSRRAPARRDIFIEVLTNISLENPEEVINYLANCYDPTIAALCVTVLGQLKSMGSVEVLRHLTKSSDDLVAAECARALAQIGDPKAIPELWNLTSHPSATVRVKAIAGLFRFGIEGARPILEPLGQDPSIDVRRTVFDALKASGDVEP